MNIAVIRGGRVREHDSHMSAVEILADLRLGEDRVYDINIDNNGEWYEKGIKTNPHAILPHIDLVINTTKEDSHLPLLRKLKIKKIFEVEPKPDNFRRLLMQLGIRYPSYITLPKKIDEKSMHDIWRNIHIPMVIKSQFRKLPTFFSYSPSEAMDYINEIHKRNDVPVIDNNVSGRNYHVVAISNLRGQKIYIPAIMESFRKYGKNVYARQNSLNEKEKEELQSMIEKIHNVLDYPLAKYDFVKTKNGFVLVSTSTRPSFYDGSLLHEAFTSSGVTFREIANSHKENKY